MKIAFIIPFTFERFFHDCSGIHTDPAAFEDDFLAVRKTWHMNWCLAMSEAGMDVTLFHLSKYGRAVRYYRHSCGIPMVRIPVTGIDKATGEEFSDIMFNELSILKPDLVFSVTHYMKARVDMYDRIVAFCNRNSIPVACRNPHSDTWSLVYRNSSADMRYFKLLISRGNIRNLAKSGYFLLRGMAFLLKDYRKYLVKRKSLRRTDVIIVQTRQDLFRLSSRFGIDEKKVLNLPKPVDQSIFHEIPRGEAAGSLNLPFSLNYLLHVSNLVNAKGCDNLIKILPEILNTTPETRLLVTGNGEERARLEKLAHDTGVNDFVVFLGHVDHSLLVYYYNIADALVLPTDLDIEGQPNVVLEALACRTPVITTNLPGPASVLNEKLGLLVDPGNPVALKNAILDVLSGYFRMDENAYKKFIKECSFENLGKILKISFTRILASGN